MSPPTTLLAFQPVHDVQRPDGRRVLSLPATPTTPTILRLAALMPVGKGNEAGMGSSLAYDGRRDLAGVPGVRGGSAR